MTTKHSTIPHNVVYIYIVQYNICHDLKCMADEWCGSWHDQWDSNKEYNEFVCRLAACFSITQSSTEASGYYTSCTAIIGMLVGSKITMQSPEHSNRYIMHSSFHETMATMHTSGRSSMMGPELDHLTLWPLLLRILDYFPKNGSTFHTWTQGMTPQFSHQV